MNKTWKMLLIPCWILGWLMVIWFESTAAGDMRDNSFRGSKVKGSDNEIDS